MAAVMFLSSSSPSVGEDMDLRSGQPGPGKRRSLGTVPGTVLGQPTGCCSCIFATREEGWPIRFQLPLSLARLLGAAAIVRRPLGAAVVWGCALAYLHPLLAKLRPHNPGSNQDNAKHVCEIDGKTLQLSLQLKWVQMEEKCCWQPV
jgi:hypothetical protein